MMKVSPVILAFITAVAIALVIALTAVIMGVTQQTALLLFIISLVLCILAFRLLYRRFIFRNLRDIYCQIYRLRYPNQPFIVPERVEKDLTGDINKILLNWNAEAREEIDQLKQVETYRREFLSNVSHELKTPIFSIQGYVHTLIDGGIDDREVNTLYLQRASRSIDRLISMVDDLESISRLESGELILEERTFDFNELVRDVIESLEMQAKEKEIRLIIGDGSDKPRYVFADKELIRQVLVNLIVNSIKYGNEHGTTQISYAENAGTLIVHVEDNGIGVPKTHLPRLFERFYRVDKSRSREQGGTGLGLAIVKHIIEAHRQQISVESEAGKFTRFTFSLKTSK